MTNCGLIIQWNILWNKEQTIDIHSNIDKSQKHYAEWKKPFTKEYIVDDATSIMFWNNENLSVATEIWDGGRWEDIIAQVQHENFLG